MTQILLRKGLNPAFSRAGYHTPHLCPELPGKNPWGQICPSSDPARCPVGGAAKWQVDTAFLSAPLLCQKSQPGYALLIPRACVLSTSLAARRGTYGFWASVQTLNGSCSASHKDLNFPSLHWRSHGLILSQKANSSSPVNKWKYCNALVLNVDFIRAQTMRGVGIHSVTSARA